MAVVPKQPVPGVGITHSGRQARRRQEERSHDWLPTIDQPVRTGRAFMEAHEIAGIEPCLALRVAQRGRTGQDQQPLLLTDEVVVGLGSLSGSSSTTLPPSRAAPTSAPSSDARYRDRAAAWGAAASPWIAGAFTTGRGGVRSGSRATSTGSDGLAVPSPCQ
jgi:hypothetical protein